MEHTVLVIGSGGREHALLWKLKQSSRIKRLYIAPGNAGTKHIAENVPIEVMEIAKLVEFAVQAGVTLTVVGPDNPLQLAIVDHFHSHGLNIFGPTSSAALIETSKAFSKKLMFSTEISTPSFRVFSDFGSARDFLAEHSLPVVVKVSGLALGKGVYLCKTHIEAEEALTRIMVDRIHGSAGDEVIIEEFVRGNEVTLHALVDGVSSPVMFPPARDYKRLSDAVGAPNTGGMGAFAPVDEITPKALRRYKHQVVLPVLESLAALGSPFVGCLYPGIIMTDTGVQVLEYNARFGDPETQVYMRLLESDFLDILEACVNGTLDVCRNGIIWRTGYAVCLVLASSGYPGKSETGFQISGIAEAEHVPGVVVFHAGTKWEKGKLITAGGRVLSVTATGETLELARRRAYQAATYIHFKGKQYHLGIAL